MPASDDARDAIKQALNDPKKLCDQLGISDGAKRQATGLIVRCPAHDENTPSCSVTVADGTIRAKCFACGFEGDVFNLIAAVNRLDASRDFKRVLEIAGGLAGIALGSLPAKRPSLRPVPQLPPEPEDLTPIWNLLPPVDSDCWEYLRSRTLDAAADYCRTTTPTSPGKLGKFASDGFVLAQAMRDAAGRVVAIQVRQITGKDFRVLGSSSSGLFGFPHLVAFAQTVVACEGFTDTLAAIAASGGTKNIAIVGFAGVQATQSFSSLPLEGKRVLIATDADEPGDECAKMLALECSRRRAKPVRARPSRGKDIAEMLSVGVDLRDFFGFCLTGFQSVASSVQVERRERQATIGKSLRFGIRFLDKALGGIIPEDLLLLGASTGRGKTEASVGIARENVIDGKRVHYLALEASRREIERRIKYPVVSSLVYDDRENNGSLWRRMNYLDWYMGNLDSELDRYEYEAENLVRVRYPTLFVKYKGQDKFDKETLKRSILDVADETDLIIVDHLHYIDTDDANENRGVKQIVQTVRDLQGKTGKPTILVVHVRKSERGRKKPQLVPSIEDIHGSSDTGKIATKAIMFAPAYDQEPKPDANGNPRPVAMTYVEPSKCRIDGSRTRFVGLVEFNFRYGSYGEKFDLGKLMQDRSKFKFLTDDELPQWARPPEQEAPQIDLPPDPPTPTDATPEEVQMAQEPPTVQTSFYETDKGDES